MTPAGRRGPAAHQLTGQTKSRLAAGQQAVHASDAAGDAWYVWATAVGPFWPATDRALSLDNGQQSTSTDMHAMFCSVP